jgi:hypothetical protein
MIVPEFILRQQGDLGLTPKTRALIKNTLEREKHTHKDYDVWAPENKNLEQWRKKPTWT